MQGKTNKSKASADHLRPVEQERVSWQNIKVEPVFFCSSRIVPEAVDQVSGEAENLSWAEVVMRGSR